MTSTDIIKSIRMKTVMLVFASFISIPLLSHSTEIEKEKPQEVLIKDETTVTSQDFFKRENFTHPITDAEFNLIRGEEFTLVGIGLFTGNESYSHMICKLTGSDTSHCSLILADKKGKWYNWESTGSLGQMIRERFLPQVQIHLWDDIVGNYGGKINYRLFTFESIEKNTPQVLNTLLLNLLGAPYERNLVELLESLEGINKKEDISTLFCSEFNAYVMMEMGYLGTTKLPDNYLPKDFTCELGVKLDLLNATLGDPLVAKTIDPNSNVGYGCVIL